MVKRRDTAITCTPDTKKRIAALKLIPRDTYEAVLLRLLKEHDAKVVKTKTPSSLFGDLSSSLIKPSPINFGIDPTRVGKKRR